MNTNYIPLLSSCLFLSGAIVSCGSAMLAFALHKCVYWAKHGRGQDIDDLFPVIMAAVFGAIYLVFGIFCAHFFFVRLEILLPLQ